MNAAAKKLVEEALALPPDQREELIYVLSDSLGGPEISLAWREEIERRLEKFSRGEAKLQDAETLFARLEAKYANDARG
ncbi:addiction module protein [Enhygromyxa salina]|uniref:Putative addiction module component n=1 Tax=Enhygromyxa salina TaxID=215803 RepID=A0A2S9YM09_9BACT|nr:addiction module protein [Enhygromyxa salina]PRQ06108.1 putative addiction module component [Enhygromyxa salina]